MDDHVISELRRATAGLLYPSETDAPFEAFVWGKAENTPGSVRQLAGLPGATECQQVSLEEFLGDLLEEQRFRALRAAVEATLSGIKVYRCGSIRVTYLVVGSDRGGRLAGLKTHAVET